MRRTIHLCQRGLPPPLRCLACGEVARTGDEPAMIHRGTPAICVNRSDWGTIYRDHADYRRCVDAPDARDKPKLARFPVPTRPGFYWAEWRIVEDGSFPDMPQWDDKPAPGLYVVDVWSRVPDGDDMGLDDEVLVAELPGIVKSQPLDNFVWRSGRLEEPTGPAPAKLRRNNNATPPSSKE